MDIFPDITLQSLKQLLKLQMAPKSVAEGCERRIIHEGEFWTAGATEVHPPSFWRDHVSAKKQLAHSVAGLEAKLIESARAVLMAGLGRLSPGNKHRTSTVHISHEDVPPGSARAPPKAARHEAPPGSPRNSPRSARRRSLQTDQTLKSLAAAQEGDALALERSYHERLGTQVLPYFVGIKDAAGPPHYLDEEGGYTSFLQACVDLSDQVQNATVFECEGLVAILDYKWNTFGSYLYTRELCIYVCLLLTFSMSCLMWADMPRGDNHPKAGKAWKYIWETLNMAFLLFFGAREYLQWRSQRSRRYFSDYWNYVDMMAYAMVLGTVMARLAAPDADVGFVIASVALLPMWFKILYYMR